MAGTLKLTRPSFLAFLFIIVGALFSAWDDSLADSDSSYVTTRSRTSIRRSVSTSSSYTSTSRTTSKKVVHFKEKAQFSTLLIFRLVLIQNRSFEAQRRLAELRLDHNRISVVSNVRVFYPKEHLTRVDMLY